MHRSDSPKDPERRNFVRKSAAIAAGAVAALVPTAAGIAVFLDPLRHTASAAEPVRVTSLDLLPSDGVPRKFSIFAARSDAWNRYASAPVGAVYLRRTGETTVEALNVICPHAGCFVDYDPRQGGFLCPCHNSRFGIDGGIVDRGSPSPRPLDTLEVEVRNGSEVWVKFQNFQTGQEKKIPIA